MAERYAKMKRSAVFVVAFPVMLTSIGTTIVLFKDFVTSSLVMNLVLFQIKFADATQVLVSTLVSALVAVISTYIANWASGKSSV